MKNKNWSRALINYEYVINANHENPFAYYYAAKAAKELGMKNKIDKYYQAYLRIRKNNSKWENIFQRFMRESVEFPELNMDK